MYKALIVDLDGTLVGKTLDISPTVAKAIRALDKIVRVTINSSRDRKVVGQISSELGLRSLQISDGGARMFDHNNDETIYLSCMDKSDAKSIVNTAYSNGLRFSAVGNENVVRDIGDIKEWKISRISILDLTRTQATRLVAQYSSYPRVFATPLLHVDKGDWMVDFTHSTANKGTALNTYAKFYGITTAQIIAAGDSYNDLPMLRVAGLSIAMGTAPNEVKDVADYIAPGYDEDGLAVAIDMFILPKLALTPHN